MAQAPTTQNSPNPVVADSPRRWKMSFDHFLEWDGDGNPDRRVEWVDGEVIELVSVTVYHAKIVAFLFQIIGIGCRVKNIGTLVGEPLVMRPIANGNGRCPDIMLIRNENESQIKDNFVDGPADLVIEVVSPNSTKTDYMVKLAEYRRAKIAEYWIIDPIGKQTSFFVLGNNGQYTEATKNELSCFESPSLDGLSIDPKWFHQDELPNPIEILKGWGLI